MKTIFAFVVILLYATVSKVWSQGYASIFAEDSTQWNQASEVADDALSLVINTVKDTIIDLKDYIQIRTIGDPFLSDFYFLREDTVTGRVWILDSENNNEYLLMDMNLSIGDTFRITTVSEGQDSIAVVNDIYYENGQKKIGLGFTLRNYCNEEQLIFMEGIGPNAGILYQLKYNLNNYGTNNILLCSFKDGEKVYSSEYSSDQCYLINNCVGLNNHEAVIATIYPNPAGNSLSIDFLNPVSGILLIYNNIGVLIKQIPIETAEKIELDISNLKEGIFIIQLLSENRIRNINRLLKI
jgi:hypothetical protein